MNVIYQLLLLFVIKERKFFVRYYMANLSILSVYIDCNGFFSIFVILEIMDSILFTIAKHREKY